MKLFSFDTMVHLYEETRVCHPVYLKAALDDLAYRFPPLTFRNVFEPGIGTGRIAVPLAHRGYHLTGVDISPRMLALLRRRLARSGKSVYISICEADASYLPFPDNTFDMSVAVHLFYFVNDWEKAAYEMLRVVKPGHPLILMHTGTGMEVPYLNQRYKELCTEYGHNIAVTGVSTTAEVVAYFKTHGCEISPERKHWEWTSRIKLENALDYLKSRAYSFTISAPDNVHHTVIEHLIWEIQQKYGSLANRVNVPNRIYYMVVTRT
jgi:ubiquinone/menaquinone biosynthesis C-methylase UbiE